MSECPRLKTCPFFNDKMASMPSTAELYKKKYCMTDCSKCARYMVLKEKGMDMVPADLFPNQYDRAKKLLS
ncbi:conserved hypothetical protein [Desulfofarcimen acetoxidans DSM 771]|uniref:Uncharacterized protein n=2 Tax=Desulfofarcimen acetoxidans TaxID=58138 RepID=C8VXA8_DESAS|nr:conserved hypothetical protein [Desulfofarcimen acetoxidans DSM 771]